MGGWVGGCVWVGLCVCVCVCLGGGVRLELCVAAWLGLGYKSCAQSKSTRWTKQGAAALCVVAGARCSLGCCL